MVTVAEPVVKERDNEGVDVRGIEEFEDWPATRAREAAPRRKKERMREGRKTVIV